MKQHDLILVGGGRFGREVAAWISLLRLPFNVVGFIDDEKNGPNIIGPIVNHNPRTNALYLTCIGNGPARCKVRNDLETNGAKFANLLDPLLRTASPLEGTSNSIFLGTIGISNDVTIGKDLLVHAFASIGHDVVIGNGVTIGSHAFVGGGAILEDECTIHPNAVVLPNVKVGRGAVIGAGSVVIKRVAPYTTVFGSPAKVISSGTKSG
jgi:sugar O-acyltransferase (sialic acid O-acetyltransferase NeuD family)